MPDRQIRLPTNLDARVRCRFGPLHRIGILWPLVLAGRFGGTGRAFDGAARNFSGTHLVLKFRNLVAIVFKVIEYSLRSRLCLKRCPRGRLSSAQSTARFRCLHFAIAGCFGVPCRNPRGCRSSPAVGRRLCAFSGILINNRNPLARLVLRKATIHFLLPRWEG